MTTARFLIYVATGCTGGLRAQAARPASGAAAASLWRSLEDLRVLRQSANNAFVFKP